MCAKLHAVGEGGLSQLHHRYLELSMVDLSDYTQLLLYEASTMLPGPNNLGCIPDKSPRVVLTITYPPEKSGLGTRLIPMLLQLNTCCENVHGLKWPITFVFEVSHFHELYSST